MLMLLSLCHKDLTAILVVRGLIPLVLEGVLLREIKTSLSLHMLEKGAHIRLPIRGRTALNLRSCRFLHFICFFETMMCAPHTQWFFLGSGGWRFSTPFLVP